MVTNGKGHRVECTCYIKEEDGVEPQIIKCSLCQTAPELYEALKAIVTEPNFGLPGKLYVKARDTLAKVEGGK